MADKSLSETATASLEEIRRDLDALKGDMTRLVDTLGDSARKGAESAKAAAAEAGQAAGEAANQAAGQMTDWAGGQYATVREQIRSQPLLACAVVAGMGLILGSVLRR